MAAIKRKSDKHFICAKQVIATPGTEEEVQQLCRGVLDFSQVRQRGILVLQPVSVRYLVITEVPEFTDLLQACLLARLYAN